MEPTWSAPVWIVFLALALGAGAGLITYWGLHIAEARRGSKTFGRWLEDGRRLCYRVIDTDALAAEAKRELFEWIGELPKDFNPTVFLTVDLARGLQQAVLYEAEHQGLVRAGTFERIFGVPSASLTPLDSVEPPPSSNALATVPANVHDIGAWQLTHADKARRRLG